MGKLIINEWVKLFRRAGTMVLVGIVILMVLGIGAFLKYEEIQNPPQENQNWKQDLTVQIEGDRAALEETGQNNANLKMFYERQIAINEYQIEHDLAPETNYNVWSFISENMGAIGFIGVFTIIIAAGMVSSEFSWGTIKLLLIRPMNRSKILLSKYITVVLFGVMMLTILYVVSAVVGLALFGLPEESLPHLAFVNGEVVERSLFLNLIGEYFLSSIDVLMLATMAFMISAVFRNSSLAIGLSLFLMFMGSSITMLLAARYEWAKYILFANTNLAVYFDGVPPVEGMTLTFSIVMLFLYFVLFQLLAFFVFSKRDVAA
ncbi:ABC transporter permease [Mesobacillus maritimus]|uniref:ABC transporter permease n=1 Tax=Mesobacillus maritimus TaxID=1643336 RepID=A0ABS7K876_9BACI|nr:ABC transporter permease [Mesobacillus maritimus]MBY0098464.1 ABC transporter permease [Mesobacillus maritimus]